MNFILLIKKNELLRVEETLWGDKQKSPPGYWEGFNIVIIEMINPFYPQMGLFPHCL
jgi:hypothetical protein